MTSHNWRHKQKSVLVHWKHSSWLADQVVLMSSVWCEHLYPRSWIVHLSQQLLMCHELDGMQCRLPAARKRLQFHAQRQMVLNSNIFNALLYTHSIYILYIACRSIRSVTLKSEVILWALRIGIMDSYSAFNAAQCKTSWLVGSLVNKNTDTTMLQKKYIYM